MMASLLQRCEVLNAGMRNEGSEGCSLNDLRSFGRISEGRSWATMATFGRAGCGQPDQMGGADCAKCQTPCVDAVYGAHGRACLSYRISAAMLTAMRSADSLTESRARCAYRAVVSTLRCPSSRPMIGSPSPSASAREAKL